MAGLVQLGDTFAVGEPCGADQVRGIAFLDDLLDGPLRARLRGGLGCRRCAPALRCAGEGGEGEGGCHGDRLYNAAALRHLIGFPR